MTIENDSKKTLQRVHSGTKNDRGCHFDNKNHDDEGGFPHDYAFDLDFSDGSLKRSH
jgi:hypothetical protein